MISQEGTKFLCESDLESVKLLALLDTGMVSPFGGWFITGAGERILLMVSYDGKDSKNTNLVHEFVNGTWKRQLTLPNQKFLVESCVVQIKATKDLLMVNAVQRTNSGEVCCYKWPQSSSKIVGKCWSITISPLSMCNITSSGFLLTRFRDTWQLVEAKEALLEQKKLIEKNRPVVALMGDSVLTTYKIGKNVGYCLLQLKRD